MKTLLAAAAVAATLVSGAVFAQSESVTMEEGLSMLETAVDREFNKLGITDVDAMSLSLSQLAQIRSVLGSSEYNTNEMKTQVLSIVSN